MIPEIKRLLPDSKISLFISNKLENLLNEYEGINSIFYYEDVADNLLNFFKSNNFDIIINVFPRKDIAVAAFCASVKTRVGTAYRFYSVLFNERIKEHRKYAIKHESDYNLNLLSYLNKEISNNKIFHLNYTDSEYSDLKRKLWKQIDVDSKYIIVHPGSKGSAIDLPVSKLINLAEYIITKYPDFKVVVTGIEQERQVTSLFMQKFAENIVDLTAMLNLRELMILIDKTNFISLVANKTNSLMRKYLIISSLELFTFIATYCQIKTPYPLSPNKTPSNQKLRKDKIMRTLCALYAHFMRTMCKLCANYVRTYVLIISRCILKWI